MAQQPYPDELTWWLDPFDKEVAARYAQVGRHYPDPNDPQSFVWRGRTAYDIAAGMTKEASLAKHLKELEDELGIVHPEPPPRPHPSPLAGWLRLYGKAWGDDGGVRPVYGCSWFPALCIAQQDPDEALRQLDRIAASGRHYVRVLWRLNGWHWSGGPKQGGGNYENANLTVDPIRDAWYEERLFWFLSRAAERKVAVNLSSGDMNNWTVAQMEQWFTRTAQIAASVSQQVVCLSAATNEMRGTMQGGESDENIALLAHLMTLWRQQYPWGQCALSDPGSQDKPGIQRLTPSPCTVGLIHNVRWSANDAIRRAFNLKYEGYPGFPYCEDEPTGPNSTTGAPFSGKVYQPVDDHDDLFAIYSMHLFCGALSTYFSDASLLNRQPLNSDWGFDELPRLWAKMELPDDIGNGTPIPGHKADAPFPIANTGAARSDGVVIGNTAFGVVSGDAAHSAVSGWDATATVYRADGGLSERHVSRGETIISASDNGNRPIVVRLKA